MSDNPTGPITSPKSSLWLPLVSLALTVAAFGLRAPQRVARLDIGRAARVAVLEFDASIRYEPVVFAGQSGDRLIAAHRVLDEVVSRHLVALR
ncbi:MAG: hypothetical protein HYV14_12390 [Elusimicrobia bacterium]|nr:hypothetical protein [Elusimicrobiota bacterium]